MAGTDTRAGLESFPSRENREILNIWKDLGLMDWFFWEQTGNGSSFPSLWETAGGHWVGGMGGKLKMILLNWRNRKKYDDGISATC